MDVQLPQDVCAVSLDRGRGDEKQAGDLLVGAPLGNHLQDLPLAIRKQVIAVFRPLLLQPPDVVLLEDAGDLAGHERAPLRYGPDLATCKAHIDCTNAHPAQEQGTGEPKYADKTNSPGRWWPHADRLGHYCVCRIVEWSR